MTPVVNDQGGKSPRNSKSNSLLQMKDAGTVQDSNSFAVLQSSEADLLDSLPERSGNSDVNLLIEPEPTSILGDELADLDCLALPDKEVETLDELPLDIETAGLAGGSRIQGPSPCEPPLPKVANLVEVPPGPSSTSVSAAPRSSHMARWVPVDSPSHPVNLPLAQGVCNLSIRSFEPSPSPDCNSRILRFSARERIITQNHDSEKIKPAQQCRADLSKTKDNCRGAS
ncbi:hypothetical protein Nepgr_002667 [Nepenthes gracilis]|uniref:Uncharacterized protein n=1 Tax=Nepenthes gracilis TaxID=150966 RepID=A0AAD3RYD8_NEPGR|nr:hypothetical protein Nepgr_002667 [Nepenthes gracilis]